ncbi:MAG: MBL fold metallo-hydrolase [Acidobacteria bacterium]|nr:MBL fold metallo-hydrolase [Acidobacteriota bacterium]
MANKALRLAHNTPGDFFVDSTCIDCDQCREIAPETFGDGPNVATVYKQPATPEQLRRSLMAQLTCPVGAIGSEQKHDLTMGINSLPEQIEDSIYFCGFSSRNSFGASSYLIVRPEGNVLMDSPRFASRLVERIEQMGGVRWMFLSHVDDIADHAKFRRRFGCERIIHEREVRASIADIECKIKGDEPQFLGPDLVAIPTPGHTRGHMVLLYADKFLFTGDHLWWSPECQGLSASRAYCWYSWEKQQGSMERLLDYRFEWVLPGHGRRHQATSARMQQMLQHCMARMRQQ